MLLAKKRTHDPQAVSATDTLANFSNKTQFQRSCPWHDSQSRILQDYFLPMIIPMKVPRMHTCTILLDVMNALPLSMIGSEHCDVFFGNTNLSTHDPSRSRTCARENIHKDTLALSCFNRPNFCHTVTISHCLKNCYYHCQRFTKTLCYCHVFFVSRIVIVRKVD